MTCWQHSINIRSAEGHWHLHALSGAPPLSSLSSELSCSVALSFPFCNLAHAPASCSAVPIFGGTDQAPSPPCPCLQEGAAGAAAARGGAPSRWCCSCHQLCPPRAPAELMETGTPRLLVLLTAGRTCPPTHRLPHSGHRTYPQPTAATGAAPQPTAPVRAGSGTAQPAWSISAAPSGKLTAPFPPCVCCFPLFLPPSPSLLAQGNIISLVLSFRLFGLRFGVVTFLWKEEMIGLIRRLCSF